MRFLIKHPWKVAASICAAYWLALFAGTHSPSVPLNVINVYDKAVHFGAFAGLAFLLSATISLRMRERASCGGRLPLFSLIVLLAVYAAADELLQIPVPGRQGSVADWLADAAGIVAGLAAFVQFHRLLRAFRRAPQSAAPAAEEHA